MHELALARGIVTTAERHAEGLPVRELRMRVGALRQVVPGSLAFYFDVVARETSCEGAALELELVDARLRCGECGAEWDPAPPPAEDEAALVGVPRFRCPECGAGGAEVVAGEEFELESIVVSEPPGPARAAEAGELPG